MVYSHRKVPFQLGKILQIVTKNDKSCLAHKIDEHSGVDYTLPWFPIHLLKMLCASFRVKNVSFSFNVEFHIEYLVIGSARMRFFSTRTFT